MKKLIFSLFFVSIALFANAYYDFMVDGLCYRINSDSARVKVVQEKEHYAYNDPSYYNLSGNIIIPSFVIYNGITFSVKSINAYAFCGCIGITSMTIPNTVTMIGEYAFTGCSSLNSAIIGENVTSIGSYTFRNCSLLENLVALRERPIFINSNVFEGVPTAGCDLHVRQGSKIRYENQDVLKDFLIIVEDAEDWADVGGGSSGSGIYGDVNGDGHVNSADVTAVYDIILGNE